MTEKEIFLAAVEIADAGEREAYLRQASGGDRQLLGRVEALLRAYFSAGSFLESPRGAESPVEPGDSTALPASDSPPEGPSGSIGPYKLLQCLGEGGMGAVYMAEQERPVKRRVALKIIKAGLDSRQVIARFEQERQALALMDHPNIAKVLDAGTTAEGRPYFVMELVKGIPLTRYCDRERLPPPERLELFIPVCQAVQHAHQKGIIHRDLKPSNVLVALYDGRAVPKVIDFGVAKATTQKLTERTMFTEVGSIIGTLEYMAPEQAELNNLDIDTRADIYSLGVILYELLTGSPPFSGAELRGAAFTEMLKMIREVEPPKPSTRLSSSAELPSIAALRKLEPKGLTSAVSGELDWIVMKCLDKERGRRYGTASALALDLERHRRDEPVEAGPPSRRYRLGKFVRRNKRWIGTAGAFAALLVSGAVTSGVLAWWARTAQREAASEAESARSNFELARAAVDKYLNVLAEDPELNQADLTALKRRLLETAIPFYEDLARRRPEGARQALERASALLRLAVVRQDLGDFEKGLKDLEQAQSTTESLLSKEPENAAVRSLHAYCLTQQGWALRLLGRLEPAQDAYQRAIGTLERLRAERPDDQELEMRLAENVVYRSEVAGDRGDLLAAESGYRSALKTSQELSDRNPIPEYLRRVAECHEALGRVSLLRGQATQAADAFTKAVSIRAELARGSPNDRSLMAGEATARELLANALCQLNQHAAMEKEYRLAIETHDAVVRGFPSRPGFRADLALALMNFGLTCTNLHRFDEAQALLTRAIAEADAAARLGPGVQKFAAFAAYARALLGVLLGSQGNYPQAEKSLREAADLYRRLSEDFPKIADHRRYYAMVLGDLGGTLGHQGKYEEAVATLREAVETLRRLVREFPAIVENRQALVSALSNLSIPLEERPEHQLEEALKACREGEEEAKKLLGEKPSEPAHRSILGNLYNRLGMLLRRMGRPADSREAYDRCLEIREQLARDFPEMHSYRSELAGTYASFGGALRAQGETERALELLEKSQSALEALLKSNPQDADSKRSLRTAWGERAFALTGLGRNAEAAEAWKRTSELSPEGSDHSAYDFGETLTSALAGGRAEEAIAACRRMRDGRDLEALNFYEMACITSVAASARPSDDPLRDRLRAEGVGFLQEAVRKGYQNAYIEADSDLDQLRGREDFQALVRGLKARAR